MPAVKEHSSFSNFADIRIQAADFDFVVDFPSKTIQGFADYQLRATNATDELVLDTRSLDIVGVHEISRPADGGAPARGAELQWSTGEPHKALGQALCVQLRSQVPAGGTARVGIQFRVNESSTAVQFLEPAQTAGGKHPYLFTQCQAIHARSLVPCQDTPNVKLTYRARVTVPESSGMALTALMSAKALGIAGRDCAPLSPLPRPASGAHSFAFEQAVAIPSYLLALAVGELESRELGPISRVWAEPSVVDAAATEFVDTNAYLEAGEAVAGPYRWGQYDLLVLPPAFPYGGMENPCLTFVTPSLIVGDRSATRVIAHEISHSWTGNLVTNATWEHFWLNEGWTMFLERKILARVHGEAVAEFQASLGLAVLKAEVGNFGAAHPFTALVPDLSGGADPDDAFSRVPYEKGFYFLYYLQHTVGGAPAFDPFIKAYVSKFAQSTCTTDDFRAFFLEYFADCKAVENIDWQTWLHSPGMPPLVNDYDDSMTKAPEALAKKWHTADVMRTGHAFPSVAGPGDIDGWSPDQLCLFLAKLKELSTLSPLKAATTRKMAELYGFDAIRHPEVRCQWLTLATASEDSAVLEDGLAFVREQGRMKYVRPIYQALFRSKFGHVAALKTFEDTKQTYHPIAAKMVASDLQLA